MGHRRALYLKSYSICRHLDADYSEPVNVLPITAVHTWTSLGAQACKCRKVQDYCFKAEDFYPNSTNGQAHHVGFTTIEIPDEGHLYPFREHRNRIQVAYVTGGHSTSRAIQTAYTLTIRNLYSTYFSYFLRIICSEFLFLQLCF